MISSSALPSRSLPAIFPFIRRLSMLLLGPVCCSSAAWALFALETHDEVDFCLFRLWLSCTIRWTASSLLNCLLLDLVAWVSAVWCADRAAEYYRSAHLSHTKDREYSEYQPSSASRKS
ncbi:hypothetical protein F5883DRAFT_576904 [Diaporthe sp. PMI_573]|nr:hypothetical protein F5883DRAFT_576904 [Diaporthaceae sp. PMI_573]